MLAQNPLAGTINPACGVGEALAARRRLLRITLPGADGFGPPMLNLGDGETFPLPEIRLAQIVIGRRGQAKFAADYGRGGGSTPQRRGDDGVDRRPAR